MRIPNKKHMDRLGLRRSDEWYTPEWLVAVELDQYDWTGRTIWLPCDPEWSEYRRYFEERFDRLGLRGLLASHIGTPDCPPVLHRHMAGEEPEDIPLQGDGDFRSPEVQSHSSMADTIVTNPPFSIWSDLLEVVGDRDMCCLGPRLAAKYKTTDRALRAERLHFGHYTGRMEFRRPSGARQSVSGVYFQTLRRWPRPHFPLAPYCKKRNPSYDNMAACTAPKRHIPDIPRLLSVSVPTSVLLDYTGQFQWIGATDATDIKIQYGAGRGIRARPAIGGKKIFGRILVWARKHGDVAAHEHVIERKAVSPVVRRLFQSK